MNETQVSDEKSSWSCGRCGAPLVLGSVTVTYLGSGYPVDLLKCPHCGNALVPEALALGKMLEVEQILEDK
jgi:ribosomal protein S27AE